MKPSDLNQQPTSSPIMAAELAQDMLSFLASMYENASTDSERLAIILRYGSVMQQLQRTIKKTVCRQRRQRQKRA
jgi:hypothetical protein